LSEQLQGQAGLLLRSAQKDAPPDSVVAATLTAVSANAVAASLTSALAAKAKTKSSLLLVKALLGGFAGGIVVVGGVEAIHHAVTKPERAPEHAAAESSLAGRARTHIASRPVIAPAEAPELAPPGEALKSLPAPTAHSVAPPVSARHAAVLPEPAGTRPEAPVPVTDPAMELEVRLLDEARSALSAHRGRDVLDALDRYARQAQSRRLAPEAAYLEMEAYVLLGDRAAALRSARDVLARYPGGPHVARARRILSLP
jgi:hypothetical protein